MENYKTLVDHAALMHALFSLVQIGSSSAAKELDSMIEGMVLDPDESAEKITFSETKEVVRRASSLLTEVSQA